MTEELEEIKSIVAINFGALGFLNPSENEQILKDRDKVLNALQRLEAIDNAKPSEAMQGVDMLYANAIDLTSENTKYLPEYLKPIRDIIKQALIKAQEQEKENTEYKKVLKIIKEKRVNIHWIEKCKTLDEYNDTLNPWEFAITQEEFDEVKKYCDGI